MNFGKHVPAWTKARGGQSSAAVFTRGLQLGGMQWRFDFPNGFGASVINDGYGGERGLYEVGVFKGEYLTYDTPITDDVLGYLTAEQVADTLDKIEALTAEEVVAEVARRADEERDRRIAELRAELAALTGEVSA